MSLVVNQSVGNSYSCENFNETIQGPIKILPDELVLEVFSHLSLATLGTICCVNKAWKRLANEPILWKIAIYREIAFGNDKWAQCFGTDVVKDEDNREEFSSLPSDDFIADCKKFKSIFPERNAKDSLMLVRLPKTLNGGLTLKSLGELAKKYFSDSDSGYRFIWAAIVQELGDKSIDKSHWVLMTKDVLPGSRAKSYGEQQKIVADLAEKSLISYEVPDTLESAVCILSQYFGSNIRLFSDNPRTYTRCKNKVQGYQTIVGGFAPAGLDIRSYDFAYDYDNIGVAALRKF
jgi:F-box-like